MIKAMNSFHGQGELFLLKGEAPDEQHGADIVAICQLISLERHWRDTAQWEKMHTAFHPESVVRITWFRGSGAQFVEASKKRRESGKIFKHRLTPSIVRVNGDRALAETTASIENRSFVGTVEVDITSYCRFFSRVRKDDGKWRLLTFDAIYEKDTIAPVNPGDKPELDLEVLRRFRPTYRYLSYFNWLRGGEADQNLPGEDRPDLVRALYEEAERWLMADR